MSTAAAIAIGLLPVTLVVIGTIAVACRHHRFGVTLVVGGVILYGVLLVTIQHIA